ncbi:predicted protein [Chaetomium globosum CBS 148.51]|uniref:Uncharacterized protein n=1 Tax=Chaetomium globosum (strain ATCC 6205 / CBS 148.51 / DSM 1962 / NBRC 6347 / NRRL 1970) TaxID=306901 RepID=Q2HAZ4_CHAGB|nr:uncharacterized protein CHGG_02610 [Chaetomium globosum CBS 148.51]EAQ90675.1 predicted protein [Chaetomium globosum CBS 148.51]
MLNRVGAVGAGHDGRTTSNPTFDEGNRNLQARAAGPAQLPTIEEHFPHGEDGFDNRPSRGPSQPLGGSGSSVHLFRGAPVCRDSLGAHTLIQRPRTRDGADEQRRAGTSFLDD